MSNYNTTDSQYHVVLRDLLDAPERNDRTGVGTHGKFGLQLKFDLHRGFPILTTKKVHFKSIVVELLWMLKGLSNIEYLHKHGVTIWDEWADKDGNLGPVYGAQWRNWRGHPTIVHDSMAAEAHDQIKTVIEGIRNNPYGRRHIVSAWNVGDLEDMALPPCHLMFQFYVTNDKRLSCHMYQRSADWFLGVPFNIAQYALLTHLMAREVAMDVGELIISYGDYHLYKNHVLQAWEQLGRISTGPEPKLEILGSEGMFTIDPKDIRLVGYEPHPNIKADVAV